jgi:hypothetical protein
MKLCPHSRSQETGEHTPGQTHFPPLGLNKCAAYFRNSENQGFGKDSDR